MTRPSGQTSKRLNAACRALHNGRTGSHDEPGNSPFSHPKLLRPLRLRGRRCPRRCLLPCDGLNCDSRKCLGRQPDECAGLGSLQGGGEQASPSRLRTAAVPRQQGVHLTGAQPTTQPDSGASPTAHPNSHAHPNSPNSHSDASARTSANTHARPNPQPHLQPSLQGNPSERILAQPVGAGYGHRSPGPAGSGESVFQMTVNNKDVYPITPTENPRASFSRPKRSSPERNSGGARSSICPPTSPLRSPAG